MGSFLPRPVLDLQRQRFAGIDQEPDGAAANAVGAGIDAAIQPPRPSIPIGMFMGGGPGAMPIGQAPSLDISSPLSRTPQGPEIGLSVDDYRAKHGLAPIEPTAGAVAPAAGARDYTAGDAAARAGLAAGAWQPSDTPWGGDVPMGDGSMGRSGQQTTVDDLAHADIEARRGRAYASIDASARNPQREQIQAASDSALYEDLIPKQRPLFDIGDPAAGGTPGAFNKGEDGTISNRMPAMRLGPERNALIAQAPEMRRQAQLSHIVAGLEQVQQGIEADLKLYAQSGGKQGMSPLDAQKAYERAERLAGLALTSISGGKDFGEFFKPQDPMQTAMALMMGQSAAK